MRAGELRNRREGLARERAREKEKERNKDYVRDRGEIQGNSLDTEGNSFDEEFPPTRNSLQRGIPSRNFTGIFSILRKTEIAT